MVRNPEELERDFALVVRGCVPCDRKVLLAVSGGSDSIGMLHLFANCGLHEDFPTVICIVDHGLRDVASEVRHVVQQGEALGISVQVEKVPATEADGARQKGSIQEWARNVRYRLLEEAAADIGRTHILTGHTRDDQAETLVQRLVRGTGIGGLSGILPQREIGPGISLVRPLLGVTRTELREYLCRRNVGWIDDPSNMDTKYSRVRIRHELIPLMEQIQPGAAAKLASLADDARGVKNLFDLGDPFGRELVKSIHLSNGLRVRYKDVMDVPSSVRRFLIRGAFREAFGDLRRLERKHINAIEELISGRRSSTKIPLPRGFYACLDRGDLFLLRDGFPIPTDDIIFPEFGADSADWARVRINFESLAVAAHIRPINERAVGGVAGRTRRFGDRLFNSRRKLKKVFSNAKIPVLYRDFVPLLVRNNEVIAVPGLVECRDPDLDVKWSFGRDSLLNDIELAQIHRYQFDNDDFSC